MDVETVWRRIGIQARILKLSLAVKRKEGKCNGKSSGTTGRV